MRIEVLCAALAGLTVAAGPASLPTAQAADPPTEDGSAEVVWPLLAGEWQGDDGSWLQIRQDGYTHQTAHWVQEGEVGLDDPGVETSGCAVFFHRLTGKALTGFYTEIRDGQAAWGDMQDPMPPTLATLAPLDAYPVMTSRCYEVGYHWVLVDDDSIVRFGTGEGMIEPEIAFTADAGAAPPPDDGPGPGLSAGDIAYETAHRYWLGGCSACTTGEYAMCWAETAGAGAPRLIVLVDGGAVTSVSVPTLGDGVSGAVRLAIDDEPPFLVDVEYWGLDGSLNIAHVDDIARVVDAFRRGYTVIVTAADPARPDYRHAYTLIGFSQTLDDVLAAAPMAPPFCDF